MPIVFTIALSTAIILGRQHALRVIHTVALHIDKILAEKEAKDKSNGVKQCTPGNARKRSPTHLQIPVHHPLFMHITNGWGKKGGYERW